MKILAVVIKQFYGKEGTVEPMYLAFTDPLRDLGHQVEHFDHYATRARLGPERCGELFLQAVKEGAYDLVLYQTANQSADQINDWVKEAGRHAPIVAWNSDDDVAWERQTSLMAPAFTFMVTTYPHIFAQNLASHPNLKLSQWGCYDRFADAGTPKDLDFTFAGQMHGVRAKSCRYLRKHAGLQAFGFLSGMLTTPSFLYWPGIRRLTYRFPSIYGPPLPFDAINRIWNRSRISYTPMEASPDPDVLQIKSRVFEMGLSGTLMICQRSPNLELYYEENREFVGFQELEECVEKVKYFLSHERERTAIANAYRRRTLGEHLWQRRFEKLFADLGLASPKVAGGPQNLTHRSWSAS